MKPEPLKLAFYYSNRHYVIYYNNLEFKLRLVVLIEWGTSTEATWLRGQPGSSDVGHGDTRAEGG